MLEERRRIQWTGCIDVTEGSCSIGQTCFCSLITLLRFNIMQFGGAIDKQVVSLRLINKGAITTVRRKFVTSFAHLTSLYTNALTASEALLHEGISLRASRGVSVATLAHRASVKHALTLPFASDICPISSIYVRALSIKVKSLPAQGTVWGVAAGYTVYIWKITACTYGWLGRAWFCSLWSKLEFCWRARCTNTGRLCGLIFWADIGFPRCAIRCIQAKFVPIL